MNKELKTKNNESNNKLKVSIIIITKNEEEVIAQCLQSLFNQSVKPFEVIVVDGHSTDNTVEIAKKYPVRIVEETGVLSPSNARNLGVENATGEIVLVMGADAELDKYCIENVLCHFEDPKVIVVVPNLEIRIHTRFEKIQKLWYYGTRSRFRTPYGTGSSIQFIRKEIYEEIRFDPRIGFGDDSDFRRRLLKKFSKTHKIVRSEGAKVLVDLPHTISEVKSQNIWYGRSSREYYAKYHGFDALLRIGSMVMPFVFLVSLVLSLVWWPAVYVMVPLFALVVARNLIICLRSNSFFFFDFLFFDLFRSIFFIYGFLQSFFVKKVGR
ncbi:MAG: glycosyltransferase family 2 protein [Clostridiales bacterium]|nr:glycosyltransferase family 2 protein [Clostridiales bacterium]